MSINFGMRPSRTGDWSWFKTMISDKALLVQYEDKGRGYLVWGYDGPEVLSCILTETADISDFDTNYKAAANNRIVVASVEGVQKVMLVPGNVGRKMVVHGAKFDAPADTTTSEDHSWAETREIQGAWFEVANHEPGDYINMFVRGDLGEGEVNLGQHGENIYVPPSGRFPQIVSEGTVSFPAGFKLRFDYVAVAGGVTRTIYVYYRMRK